MIDKKSLEIEMCNFAKENLLAKDVVLEPETSLSSIGMDSFSLIEIVLFLERKFSIELPDEVLTPENIASISAMANCAIAHTKEN